MGRYRWLAAPPEGRIWGSSGPRQAFPIQSGMPKPLAGAGFKAIFGILGPPA